MIKSILKSHEVITILGSLVCDAQKYWAIVGAAVLLSISTVTSGANQDRTITIFTNPTCTCNNFWAADLSAAGYTVAIEETDDLSLIKKQAGVTKLLRACQTSVVSEYILEGSVPPSAINKLLRERPNVRGIALPEQSVVTTKPICSAVGRSTIYAFGYEPNVMPSLFFQTED